MFCWDTGTSPVILGICGVCVSGFVSSQSLLFPQEQIHSQNVSSWYYLDGRMIKLKSDKEWLSFDVTNVLRVWAGSSGQCVLVGGGGPMDCGC